MEDHSQSCRLTPFNSGEVPLKAVFGQRPQVSDFKLTGRPRSAREFCGLLHSSTREDPMVIWLSNDCFVHNNYAGEPYDCLLKFQWRTLGPDGGVNDLLAICCKTLEAAISCLGNLLEFTLGNFTLTSMNRREMECPLSCEALEKFIVQNQAGTCQFSHMIFTESQSKTLATSGTKTHLHFYNCSFQDSGMAFSDAYLSIENQEKGPTKVDFGRRLALGGIHLITCLPKLKELRITDLFDLGDVELCRAIMSAELDYLGLESVMLTDEALPTEQILIDNVREGRGPKGIAIGLHLFSSNEKSVEFCEALSYPNVRGYLKSLKICGSLGLDPRFQSALLAAWRGRSLELTSFGMTSTGISEAFWNCLLDHIRLQSSLRRLDFLMVYIPDSTATEQARTEQLSKVILDNKYIEQMEFGSPVFDQEVWEKRVIPALHHNEHRDKFDAMEKTNVGHTRQAVLARAVDRVSDRPALLYTLLHRNLNVIVECVAVAKTNQSM